MIVRKLLALTFVAGAAAIAPANAAITVLGNGLGSNCYQFAEFGGNTKDGIALCNQALDHDTLSLSDRAATFINRGILRSRAGDSSGALDDYNRGLNMDGTHAEGFVDRGATFIALQRYDDAMSDINKGIEMGAHNPHIAYYDRAIVNEAMGNVRAAYLDYKKAVELEPEFALATQQLTRFKVVRKESNSP